MKTSRIKLLSCILVIAMFLSIESCHAASVPSQSPIPESILPTQTLVPLNTPQTYIGLKYPPLPGFIIMGGGQLITPSSSPDDWAVSIVTDGNNFMLWFDKVLYRDQDGRPHWGVSDSVIIPALKQEQGFIVSGCFLNSVMDSEIVALVNIDQQEWENRWLSNKNILHTWRANQNTGKLENLSTTNIECNAETFLGYP